MTDKPNLRSEYLLPGTVLMNTKYGLTSTLVERKETDDGWWTNTQHTEGWYGDNILNRYIAAGVIELIREPWRSEDAVPGTKIRVRYDGEFSPDRYYEFTLNELLRPGRNGWSCVDGWKFEKGEPAGRRFEAPWDEHVTLNAAFRDGRLLVLSIPETETNKTPGQPMNKIQQAVFDHLTSGEGTTMDRVRALEYLVSQNFFFTPRPVEITRNNLDYFLRSNPLGFCQEGLNRLWVAAVPPAKHEVSITLKLTVETDDPEVLYSDSFKYDVAASIPHSVVSNNQEVKIVATGVGKTCVTEIS